MDFSAFYNVGWQDFLDLPAGEFVSMAMPLWDMRGSSVFGKARHEAERREYRKSKGLPPEPVQRPGKGKPVDPTKPSRISQLRARMNGQSASSTIEVRK